MPENQITYEGPNVAFFDVGTGGASRSGENPGGGGEVIVQSTYFDWEYPTVQNGIVTFTGGFTGTGWWGVDDYTSSYQSPTQAGGFQNDQEVEEHLKDGTGNLNAAFAAWQTYINGLDIWKQGAPVQEFGDALASKNGAGCMRPVS